MRRTTPTMPTRCGAIRPRISVSTFSRNTARHITSVDHGVTATRSDLIERVSTRELLLDFVFVFTITQRTKNDAWSSELAIRHARSNQSSELLTAARLVYPACPLVTGLRECVGSER